MASKRAADQAFSDGVLVTAASGFDAPPPQVRNYDNISPSKLPIPGRWPGNEESYISDIEQAASARRSILSWMGEWALAKVKSVYQYIRPQQVIVQPIVREDGARKKRIIGAAPAEPAISKVALTDEPPSPTTVLNTRASVIPRQASHPRTIEEVSPNSHLKTIRNSSSTPVRKALLKRHAYSFLCETEARKNCIAETEARKNRFAEAEAEHAEAQAPPTSDINTDVTDAPTAEEAYQAYYNHVQTVDQDLGDLPDAPPVKDLLEDLLGELLEESDPNYRPKPRTRKNVQWSEFSRTKPFYYDAAACDMLDSTLEAIHSPAKLSFRDGQHQEDSDSDATDRPIGSPVSSQGQDSPQQSATVGFTGVPDATWDDSDESLSELQLSEEILSEVREAHLAAVAAAPPSPSPPPAPVVVIKDLVTPASSDELNKIKTIATASNDGKNKDYQIQQYKVSAHDFSTLLPGQFSGDPRAWLNDQIVNEYLNILTVEAKKRAGYVKSSGSAPPVHVFSSFFYPTLKGDKGLDKVVRWSAKANLGGEKYLDGELLLYPICHNGHWRLLAVKPKERTIEYLDSLGGDGYEFIDAFKGYLARELKKSWVPDEWIVLNGQRSVRQKNSSDCGVFTVLNALALLEGRELTSVLSCDGMQDARERIAVSLIAGAITEEFA